VREFSPASIHGKRTSDSYLSFASRVNSLLDEPILGRSSQALPQTNVLHIGRSFCRSRRQSSATMFATASTAPISFREDDDMISVHSRIERTNSCYRSGFPSSRRTSHFHRSCESQRMCCLLLLLVKLLECIWSRDGNVRKNALRRRS
jgi:hypothetical protein